MANLGYQNLSSPIKTLGGIAPKVLEKLRKLGLKKVEDLLMHFPFRYDDFSNIKKIADLVAEEKTTITARVLNIGAMRTWKKKMHLTEALLSDQSAPLRAVWFNQPYLTQSLKKDLWANFSGKVSLDNTGLYFSNPVFEILGNDSKGRSFSGLHTASLVPIYPETQGLTSRWLRLKIKSLLNQLETLPDFLPDFILKNHSLISFDRAIRQIHFPKNILQSDQAKKRLAFNDLFLLQLFSQEERKKIKAQLSPVINLDLELTKKFIGSLPFCLTNSQKLAGWQILQDLNKSSPMNRILIGEVGSGKTVVAAMAALNAAQQNYQIAFMAPTEILAIQHFKTISDLLRDYPFKIALLTSSQNQTNNKKGLTKKDLIKKISAGEINIIIGTHALIQKEVAFKNLGLIIVDEQHRFGVEQRAQLVRGQTQTNTLTNVDFATDKSRRSSASSLRESAIIPHLLTMTATPIPRTMALTLYGDLDLSLLKELPQGRKKIITKIVAPANRDKAYEFIEKQILTGRQAFVICPLIEESKAIVMNEIKAALAEYEKLSRHVFPHLKIGLLHGRLKSQEKERVMKNFKEGEINILVSTSVVEVGIDVPNASVMMVEGADRFGLSQLHQFRGRVGRAEHQSYCFLFTESSSKATYSRLKALVDAEDGFKLAERDLQIRGPGQFFGTQQSGLPDLAMASLKDTKLIEEVQLAVKNFLSQTSLDDYPLLQNKLADFKQGVHWE